MTKIQTGIIIVSRLETKIKTSRITRREAEGQLISTQQSYHHRHHRQKRRTNISSRKKILSVTSWERKSLRNHPKSEEDHHYLLQVLLKVTSLHPILQLLSLAIRGTTQSKSSLCSRFLLVVFPSSPEERPSRLDFLFFIRRLLFLPFSFPSSSWKTQ